MNAPAEVQGGRRAALVFIFITIVLDMLALGLIIPVLPGLIEDFLGGDTAGAAKVYGVFGTVWALMQFFSMPIAGSLSDRFGRRPVVLLSNLGLGLDYVLMALAPNLAWLFVGRVISGITAASVSTGMAYVADVTPPEKRSGAFGMLGVAFGIGFVFGPALGGVLGTVDPRLPFWVAAGLSLANAAYGYFVLPESLPPEKRRPFEWRRSNPLGSLRLLRSHPELTGLAGVVFLNNLAHAALPATFVLYAGYRYGWDARTVGLTLGVIGDLLGGRAGDARRAAGAPLRRAPDPDRRTAARCRGVRDVRRRADGYAVRRCSAGGGALGACLSRSAGAHVPTHRSVRAGAVAGRERQRDGHRHDDRARDVRRHVRLFHR